MLKKCWSHGKYSEAQEPSSDGGWEIQFVSLTTSPITQNARGWQICTQMESGTWFPLPGTLGVGYLCRTDIPCPPLQQARAGGKETGTTWLPPPGTVRYQEGLNWAPALGSGWPSPRRLGTKADPSGMCSRGSRGSWWWGPPGCPEGL